VAEQTHGVSPAELALGNLALARVDFARGDSVGARGDFQAATAVAFDDLRFHEDAVDTLVMLGDVEHARKVAEAALGTWPASRRLRLALAELALAVGKPSDALAELAKQPELVQWPVAMALRGEAHLESGDVDGARGDFEAALAKQPDLEPALVGRAWLALDAGDVNEARTQIEPHYRDGASPELATIYAATLRASGDPAQRDKAKAILDKVVAGAPSAATGRARLELARLDRDLGDFRAARADYAEASRTGSFDARLESGLLQIEDRDLAGGRDTLDQLYKEAADHATPNLVLELARARMLVGDHAGAQQLLESAAKMPGVTAWKLAREQGRLALRRGEFAAAAKALSNALDSSGDDSETFLLAADAATADIKNGLADKITKLATDRIGKRPEAGIVTGKLLVAAGKDADAAAAFRTAREQLKTEKASARRLAQADYGLAVTAYDRQNDPDATSELELVMNEDPSIYDAYLFAAEVAKEPKKKYELARKATQYNPDYPRAWAVVGKLAFKLGEKPALADALARLAVLAPHGDEVKELQALHK
jgi:Tfp pilus assembly protein PilF